MFGNIVVHDKKSYNIFNLGSAILTGLVFQPITHEEGHRSILSQYNIGSISQPVFDKKLVAKVVGVSDETLIGLRNDNLPAYIHLHSAGLESDLTYLNALNRKLVFDEEAYSYVSADMLVRNMGVLGYYLTSWVNRGFSLDEYASSELERDIVGHDIWGMARHLYRPDMEFHRYTTWDELTPEEKRFANRTAALSLLNLLNPQLYNMKSFSISETSSMGFNIGYFLSPFGDYLEQNIFYHNKSKGIKLNPFFREYFNKDHTFLAGGIRLQNYELNDKILINTVLDLWAQPKELSFTTKERELGAGVGLNGAYKIMERESKRKHALFLDIGVKTKTKGFLPENPSLNNSFRINIGLVYAMADEAK